MRCLRADSLNARILRNLAFGMLLAMVCHGLAAWWLYRAGSEALVHGGLTGQAEDIADNLSFDAAGRPRLTIDTHMQWGYDAYWRHMTYRVLDAQGRVLLSSDAARVPLVRERGAFEPRFDRFVIARAGESMQVVTVPARVDGRALWIQAARSDRFLEIAEETIMPVMLETSLVAGGFALLLFAAVTWTSVRGALRPVRMAAAAAATIGPRNPSARVPSQAMPSDLAPLVDAVNAGLARLEAGYLAQQRFLANAAHELKTPLALVRGRIELDGRPACRAAVLRELDGMARIVGQLLHLAEAADPASYRRGPVLLQALVERACVSVAPMAVERRVAVDIAFHGESPLDGDGEALFAAIRNLLENAVRHSPQGGRVLMRIAGTTVVVRDEGRGLSPDALAHAFDRFWREDRNGDGAGLGLAITREVVEAHGGSVIARNRPDGTSGAEFVLTLPAQSPR